MTVVVAFSLFYAAGISSFDSPWWVHVHAVTFVGWIAFYVCATICVIAPAWGRLIVLSGSPMTAPVNAGFLLLYVIAGMLFDWSNRGRVHPAYVWGAAALILFAANRAARNSADLC